MCMRFLSLSAPQRPQWQTKTPKVAKFKTLFDDKNDKMTIGLKIGWSVFI